MTTSYGSRPLGAAIGAIVAGYLGVEACLFLAMGGFLIQFLIILLSPVSGLRVLPVEQETGIGAGLMAGRHKNQVQKSDLWD